MSLARGGALRFDHGPLVMGIINTTPDSFFPGSRHPDPDSVAETAARMVQDGAGILDVGGESSRPGSAYVESDEEISRVVPAVRAIRRLTDAPISVDTRKSAVARAALDEGADIVNDISGLRDDPDLARLVAREGVPVILMHMRGTPRTMQDAPHYEDTVVEIVQELQDAVRRGLEAGVASEHIIVDPGIGFGKRHADNLRILAGIPRLAALGFPILIGLSRKSFLGRLTGRDVGERLAASLAANVYAAVMGAHILRVHDVTETVDALRVVRAIHTA
jgi:dihydropteroate synthase